MQGSQRDHLAAFSRSNCPRTWEESGPRRLWIGLCARDTGSRSMTLPWPSIAVDSRGLIHMIFYWSRYSTCYCVHLEYATNPEGAWTNSTVLNVPDTMVGRAGLALDSQGNAIIGIAKSIEAGGVATLTN